MSTKYKAGKCETSKYKDTQDEIAHASKYKAKTLILIRAETNFSCFPSNLSERKFDSISLSS